MSDLDVDQDILHYVATNFHQSSCSKNEHDDRCSTPYHNMTRDIVTSYLNAKHFVAKKRQAIERPLDLTAISAFEAMLYRLGPADTEHGQFLLSPEELWSIWGEAWQQGLNCA
jgi:hypothetical protein